MALLEEVCGQLLLFENIFLSLQIGLDDNESI